MKHLLTEAYFGSSFIDKVMFPYQIKEIKKSIRFSCILNEKHNKEKKLSRESRH